MKSMFQSESVNRITAAVLVTLGVLGAPKAMAADTELRANPQPGLTYKGVNIQLGGFLASEMVYRTNDTASDIATNFGKIPFQNSSGYGMPEFRGTERQSRFSLLAQGDYDADTHLSGYYELDFLGTSPTSNANESNSYTPRTRNVYMTLDWSSGFHILAGQNWSLVTPYSKGLLARSEQLPQTVDAQYAAGFNWARQWQLRVVKDWQKTFWAALSLENAQTVGLGGSAASGTGNTYQLAAGSLMSSSMSFNSYPDIVAKFAWDSGFGHYELYNLLRNFQSRYGGTTAASQTNKQSTWSEAVGAVASVPVVPSLVDLNVSALYGKGIGRYGASTLSDVTYGSDGSLSLLGGLQYLAQIAWHVNHEWDAYATYGQEKIDSAASSDLSYGYGDGVVADNSGCNTLGGTCNPNLKDVQQMNVGFWWSIYKGDYGTAKLGAQYSHTILDTFADKLGSAPSTSQDMAFTSLRYYPF